MTQTLCRLAIVTLFASPFPASADDTAFELRDGDRVILLGGTLIEREQRYGYWETALTAAYPDRNVTFRNLGRPRKTKSDAMPILNVDDELLDWGATVGETFRSMGLAVRQSGIRGGVRTSQARSSDNRYYGGYSNYGRYGYYVGDNSQSQTNVIRAEERGQERMSRYENWNELENATTDIRRRMTQKYGVEF